MEFILDNDMTIADALDQLEYKCVDYGFTCTNTDNYGKVIEFDTDEIVDNTDIDSSIIGYKSDDSPNTYARLSEFGIEYIGDWKTTQKQLFEAGPDIFGIPIYSKELNNIWVYWYSPYGDKFYSMVISEQEMNLEDIF